MQTGFIAPAAQSELLDETYIAAEGVNITTEPYVLLGPTQNAEAAPSPSKQHRPEKKIEIPLAGLDPFGLLTPTHQFSGPAQSASSSQSSLKKELPDPDLKSDLDETDPQQFPAVPVRTDRDQQRLAYYFGVGSAAYMSSVSQLPPVFQIGAASMIGMIGAETISSFSNSNSMNKAPLRKNLLFNAVGSAAALSTLQYLFSETVGFWALPLGFVCAKVVAPCVKQALAPCVKPYAANLSTWWSEKARTISKTIKKFDLPVKDTSPAGSGLIRKMSF